MVCWRFGNPKKYINIKSKLYNDKFKQKTLNTIHNIPNIVHQQNYTFDPNHPLIGVSQSWNKDKTFFESIYMERNIVKIYAIADITKLASSYTYRSELRDEMNLLVRVAHGDEIVTNNLLNDLIKLRKFHLYTYRKMFQQQYMIWLNSLPNPLYNSVANEIKSIADFRRFCENVMYPLSQSNTGTRLYFNIASNLRLVYYTHYSIDSTHQEKGYTIECIGYIRQTYISSEETSFHFKSFHGGLKLSTVRCWELLEFINNNNLIITDDVFNNNAELYYYFGGSVEGAPNLRKQIVVDLQKLFDEINSIFVQYAGVVPGKRTRKKLKISKNTFGSSKGRMSDVEVEAKEKHYNIPEYFKDEKYSKPYSLSKEMNKPHKFNFCVHSSTSKSSSSSTETVPRETILKVMSIFSKKVAKINKREKILLEELDTHESDSLDTKKRRGCDAIKTLRIEIQKLQDQKVNLIKRGVVSKLEPNEKKEIMNMNISFMNFPDEYELDFMTNLVDILLNDNHSRDSNYYSNSDYEAFSLKAFNSMLKKIKYRNKTILSQIVNRDRYEETTKNRYNDFIKDKIIPKIPVYATSVDQPKRRVASFELGIGQYVTIKKNDTSYKMLDKLLSTLNKYHKEMKLQ